MARAHSFQLRGSGRQHHPDLQRESSTDSAESLEALAKTLKGGQRPGKNDDIYFCFYRLHVCLVYTGGRAAN
jgi:hypothetical protein